MEDKTVTPRNNRAGEGAMRETIRRDEHGGTGREKPYVDETNDIRVVAQVEEEVVPQFLFVCISTHRDEDEGTDRVCNVYPPDEGKGVSEWKRRRCKGVGAYEGMIPNIRAEVATAMTPRKKEIFSRVLTTFVDCHVAMSEVIRLDTYKTCPNESALREYRASLIHARTLSLNFCISLSRSTE